PFLSTLSLHDALPIFRRELRTKPIACLVDRRAIVGRLVRLRQSGGRVDLAVIVVYVAAEIGRPEAPVIGIATQQKRVADESTALRRDECQPILIDVRIRVRLSWIPSIDSGN